MHLLYQFKYLKESLKHINRNLKNPYQRTVGFEVTTRVPWKDARTPLNKMASEPSWRQPRKLQTCCVSLYAEKALFNL